VTALAGKAQWRLQSPGAPLSENLYPQVRRLPEVKAAAPVVESVLELAGPHHGPLLLLGIDPFSERPLRDYRISPGVDFSQTWRDFFLRPDAVLVSRKLADRLGLQLGDQLPVILGPYRRNLNIVGFFSSPRGLYPLDGAVALMDLAPAQELLDRVGRLDYIDVLGTGDAMAVLPHLRTLAPPGVEIAAPGAASRQMEGLVASYRLNLAVLSAIALFVGMFLIYQSVTMSVVRRRREIGLLRTLGMTPRQVLVLFLAEGLARGGGWA
jgi:putative ABC transport system permease protein